MRVCVRERGRLKTDPDINDVPAQLRIHSAVHIIFVVRPASGGELVVTRITKI